MQVENKDYKLTEIGAKSLTIKVDSDFHRRLKVYASKKGISIKDYIVNTLTEDMDKTEEK